MTATYIPCQRFLFDIPDDVAYLNCAFMAPSLKSVRAAGEMGVVRKSTPWMIKPQDFFNESDQVRELIAELIGSRPRDIAIIPSVSYGIAIAAANLRLKPDQHCLLLAEQFPSNYYAWSEKVTQRKIQIKTVGRPADGNWTDAVLSAVCAQTGIVTLPHCHWTDGSMLDLEIIAQYCQENDIPLVLDVTQSLGAMPLNLARIKPAFMVAAAYKWLLGPYSLSFMYVDPQYQTGTPLEYNWITRENCQDFGGLVNYTPAIIKGAPRFDVGERSNFVLLPMAIAALEQILSWGVSSIQASLNVLTLEISERAHQLGFSVGSSAHRSGHLIGIRLNKGLPENLAYQLAEQNIFVSVRGDAIRISPHVFNHEGDINRFFSVLKWLLRKREPI